MTTTKEKRVSAEKELRRLAGERDRAERTAQRKRKALFAAMERAQTEGGVPYRRIAEVCGVSEVRVCQILAEVRKAGVEVDA
jgi:hypothetical protein